MFKILDIRREDFALPFSEVVALQVKSWRLPRILQNTLCTTIVSQSACIRYTKYVLPTERFVECLR